MRDDPQAVAFFQDMKHLSALLDMLETNTRPILNGESFLTDTELAQHLKLTKRTLQEYRNTGKIPFYQIGGKNSVSGSRHRETACREQAGSIPVERYKARKDCHYEKQSFLVLL